MGCCGARSTSPQLNRKQGTPTVTGYALDLPDGRTVTWLTRQQAEEQKAALNLDVEVREVLGWT